MSKREGQHDAALSEDLAEAAVDEAAGRMLMCSASFPG